MAGPTTDAGAADAVTARPPIPDEILGPRLIAIGRRLPSRAILAIGEGLLAGGVRAFEVTLDSDSGLASLELLAGRLGPAGLLVGAGTVLDVESAARARDAGAQFIVAPHTDAAVVQFAAGNGIPAFPGAFTPTEMLVAWRAGASAVKLFPASAVGPTFVRELRGPFRDIPLIPTGGVT
ncbi:MAG: bifunctional 4-hydroxy-2-oxoglutarate aldolase/2-dehydro-3-deoxy-phosphogluconate aldolase, partial [Chloroflexota bacterium]